MAEPTRQCAICGRPVGRKSRFGMLTDRQTEVARLIAEGRSNKAIARELGLSVHTVKRHVERLAQKLGGDGPPRLRIMAWYYRTAAHVG